MRERGWASCRRETSAARRGRLPLLAALLLGIVTMHTLGHPAMGHDGGPGHLTRAAHLRADLPRSTQTTASAEDPAVRPAGQPAAHSAARPSAGPTMPAKGAAAHGTGMDPGSVCLAVLSFWALALLGAGLLLAGRAADLLAATRARLLRGLRPIPPPLPRHKLLARLSVLRV
ncbi:hypothetical protein [Streptomyces sp. MST-110588]|uniref:hypothetical protein n=1 Tax=Streptomyces sp. MST-110588 TaxID=2833628 RepID=UPI002063450F|nr:hypothetical protein [Streptomyces sp. MST-110588]UNO42423.1 hypothetical protein KGS77_26490 [Streptomyces sp. MST-110588]